jgi:hypothetical protein
MTHMATRSQRFELSLDIVTDRGLTYDERVLEVSESVLLPLVQRAVQCRLFRFDEELVAKQGRGRARKFFIQRDRWITDFVRRSSVGTEVDLGAPGVLEDAAFWAWVAAGGLRSLVRAVLVVPLSAVDTAHVFDYSVDPHLVWNLSASVPAAALTFAKRQVAAADRASLIFDSSTGGPVALSLVAPKRQVAALFKAAVACAHFSDGFLEELYEPGA